MNKQKVITRDNNKTQTSEFIYILQQKNNYY